MDMNRLRNLTERQVAIERPLVVSVCRFKHICLPLLCGGGAC